TQNRNNRQESNSLRNPENILNINHSQNNASVSSQNCDQAVKPSLDDYSSEDEYAMIIAAEEQLNNQRTIENYSGVMENQQTSQNISNLKRFDDPYDEEIEMLIKLEKELENKECSKNTKYKTHDLFQDDFDPDQIDHVLEMTNHGDKIKTKITQNRNNRQESNSLRNPQNILDINHLQNNASASNTNCGQAVKPSLDDYLSEDEYAMIIAAEEQLKYQRAIENYCGRENQQTNQNISNVDRLNNPHHEEMLIKLERELENKEYSKNKKCKTTDLFEDDFDPDQIEHVLEIGNLRDKVKSKSTNKMHDKHQCLCNHLMDETYNIS
ncbi:hypothetical protein HHI36_012722, partial [Cryptolaemus montrouzieri]